MNKPTLADYGITEGDVAKAQSAKKWLIVSALGLMVLGFVFLTKYEKTPYIWLLLLIAIPPYGPIVCYYVLKYVWCLAWPVYRLVQAFKHATDKYEKWWIRTQVSFWDSLTGRQFEREVANLLSRSGYSAQLTPASDDKGVDIILGNGTIVQCKAHKKRIGPAVAREVYGTLRDHKPRTAILVSKSGFTRGVIEFARGKPIHLWDVKALIEMQKNRLKAEKGGYGQACISE